MKSNIDELMRRTRGYWYQDGLVETLTGLFFVFIGLLALGEWASPPDWPWRWVWAPAFPVVVFAWILGGRKVITWLKERITYPRTGYVVYKRPQKEAAHVRGIVAGLVAAAIAAVIVISLTYHPNITRLVPVIVGTSVAILLLFINLNLSLIRFYVLSVWSVIVGGILAWLTADIGLSLGIYYLALGLAIGLGGLIALIRYLCIPPVVMMDEEPSIPLSTSSAPATRGDEQ